MPAFLVPLHEYNHCHNPEGTGGGQFCGKDAFVPRPPKKPLPFTRRPTAADEYSSQVFMTPRERHHWEKLKRETMAARLAMGNAEEAALRAGDPLGLLKSSAIKNSDDPDLVALRHKHEARADEMRFFAEEVTRRGVQQVARELDFPARNIRIINDPEGRTFEVGGQQWKEGGHYNPETDVIQVNIATSKGLGLVRLIAHEIAHAKYEFWRSAMDREAEVLKTWEPAGLKDLTTRNRSPFSASGDVRPEFRAEFRRTFPAHAVGADTWGHGYSSRSLSQQMMKDDGFTDYSKAYWADANDPAKQTHHTHVSHTGRTLFSSTLSKAINETLSEVAAWRVTQRMRPLSNAERLTRSEKMKQIFAGQAKAAREKNAPSKSWRKFAAQINQFYRAHGHT